MNSASSKQIGSCCSDRRLLVATFLHRLDMNVRSYVSCPGMSRNHDTADVLAFVAAALQMMRCLICLAMQANRAGDQLCCP